MLLLQTRTRVPLRARRAAVPLRVPLQCRSRSVLLQRANESLLQLQHAGKSVLLRKPQSPRLLPLPLRDARAMSVPSVPLQQHDAARYAAARVAVRRLQQLTGLRSSTTDGAFRAVGFLLPDVSPRLFAKNASRARICSFNN